MQKAISTSKVGFSFEMFDEKRWKIPDDWKANIKPNLQRIEGRKPGEIIHGNPNDQHVKVENLPSRFQRSIKQLCADVKIVYKLKLSDKEHLWFLRKRGAVFHVIRYDPNHRAEP